MPTIPNRRGLSKVKRQTTVNSGGSRPLNSRVILEKRVYKLAGQGAEPADLARLAVVLAGRQDKIDDTVVVAVLGLDSCSWLL